MRWILPVLAVLLLASCTTLTLKPVQFAWPVESVLTTDRQGMVEEERYMLSFNVKPLLFEETGDSLRAANITIRLIRNEEGFYFVTSRGFRHVYVFAPGAGSLTLKKKILIAEQGMDAPVFNQRSPYIQLLNGKDKPRRLTSDGVFEEGKP